MTHTTKTSRQLSYLKLKIHRYNPRLSYAVLNIAAPCSKNTKLPLNQTCARIRFWSGKDLLTLEFVSCNSWYFMLWFYWILFFLKNVPDYEKIDIRIQISKRCKLNPPPRKRRSDVFRSKVDLRVALNQ